MQNWQLIRDGKMSSETFVQRARILDLMREWFRKQEFLEVETPLMLKYPGMEPHLNLFSSEFVSEDGKYMDKRFLHTSPEYGMKKLLGAGFERIYQIGKVFRNGEVTLQTTPCLSSIAKGTEEQEKEESDTFQMEIGIQNSRHNPEFTMLEWYRTNADYNDIMDDCESMIKYVSRELGVGSREHQKKLDVEWERLTVRDAFQRYADMDLDELKNIDDLRNAVEAKGYEMNTEYTWDDLFFLVLLNEIEPQLGKEKPQFLIDYPATQAALAKKKAHTCEKHENGNHFCETEGYLERCEAEWAERFELYINGIELCNAFTELVDPEEQRERLLNEKNLRDSMEKEPYGIDEAFLEALETMPPSGGNALGIDRLVMVLLGKKSIEEVLLFPWRDVS
ncbi:MAG: EF-P lysine aminoacylase GenX [Candidatus Gracilibacteria bacterium]|nr:EF-P lysine aminoacylase GenX [Candidatus Gracilibacteria bacterium]